MVHPAVVSLLREGKQLNRAIRGNAKPSNLASIDATALKGAALWGFCKRPERGGRRSQHAEGSVRGTELRLLHCFG